VRVSFEDGSESFDRWDGVGRWKRLVYERSQRVREATVDPSTAWLLDVDLLNNGRRRTGTRLPAARPTSGLGFWVETAFQIIGF